jgi:hypothetical protein
MEKFDQELKKHKSELPFEKKSFKPDAISYIFKNVIVTIDSSGKNYKRLPEVQFGTFDEIVLKNRNQKERGWIWII